MHVRVCVCREREREVPPVELGPVGCWPGSVADAVAVAEPGSVPAAAE